MIRPAHLEDAPAIAHVHVASWRSTYVGIVPESYLASLNEADFTTRWTDWLEGDASISTCVAETDGTLFGFASGGPIRKPTENYDGELYAIYLLPSTQRAGIGRKLVQHIAEDLLEQGRSRMLVWVLRDNPTTAFYQHLGATPVKEDTIEIGGISLPEIAYGWSLTDPLLAPLEPRRLSSVTEHTRED